VTFLDRTALSCLGKTGQGRDRSSLLNSPHPPFPPSTRLVPPNQLAQRALSLDAIPYSDVDGPHVRRAPSCVPVLSRSPAAPERRDGPVTVFASSDAADREKKRFSFLKNNKQQQRDTCSFLARRTPQAELSKIVCESRDMLCICCVKFLRTALDEATVHPQAPPISPPWPRGRPEGRVR
jgi:hypothetical protein